MKSPFLNLRSCLLVPIITLGLFACERDQVNTEVVAVYPAAGKVVPAREITFRWIGNGYEKYHFRFGNADLSTVRIDSTLSGTSMEVSEWLEPGRSYRFEVRQGQAFVSVPFTTESIYYLELLSPAPSSTLPMYGAEFKWRCNAAGPYQFKLSKVSDGAVVVDTATMASSYVLHQYLNPAESYLWQVSRAGVAAEATVLSATGSLLTLLAPAANTTIQPCCGDVFRWRTVLPPPYRLVITQSGAATATLDTTLQDTEFVSYLGLLPAANYDWRVEAGATTANQGFDVQRLEQMFPGPINGTIDWTHYDDFNGYSYGSSVGTHTIANASDYTGAVVDNGSLIPLVNITSSRVRYKIGGGNNFSTLEVYFAPRQVVYTHRTGGVGIWDETRFVGQ